MQTYILLVNFTDQGMRKIKETISRADAFEAMAKKSGAIIKVLRWTIGRYDVIAIFEAPDDERARRRWRSVPPRSAMFGPRSCGPSRSRK